MKVLWWKKIRNCFMTPDDFVQEDGDRDEAGGDTGSLGGLTDRLGLDPDSAVHDPLLGSTLGDVTLTRMVAEGGMGRVYEAFQAKPRRTVAVKVMRPGRASAVGYRRFEREQEVLGRLQHPYIAQIYSAGVCAVAGAEVPYFVMEFVPDALQITQFAARTKLTIEERLELFMKVCEAVGHGHGRNVIHRDLKPSNILVEPSGVPKVIDFGLARSVCEPTDPMTALTDVGQVIGTLQYMSPEQLTGSREPLDKRSDVYSLGLILHELLTGRPPYDVRQKPLRAAADIVRTAARQLPEDLSQVVEPQVREIVGRSLEWDRERRYPDAVEMAKALRERSSRHVITGSSASAEELLGCPHCHRPFYAKAEARGKMIRCRGCRQIFHVPVETASTPLRPVVGPQSDRVEHDHNPPVAPSCMIDGQDARRCPKCSRRFRMKAEFIGKVIRCRDCKSPFRVLAARGRTDISSRPEEPRLESTQPAEAGGNAPGGRDAAGFRDDGDVLDEELSRRSVEP